MYEHVYECIGWCAHFYTSQVRNTFIHMLPSTPCILTHSYTCSLLHHAYLDGVEVSMLTRWCTREGACGPAPLSLSLPPCVCMHVLVRVLMYKGECVRPCASVSLSLSLCVCVCSCVCVCDCWNHAVIRISLSLPPLLSLVLSLLTIMLSLLLSLLIDY